MKYVLILFLGIGLGIGGEFFILDEYTMNVTTGCYISDKHYVFLPSVTVTKVGVNPWETPVPLVANNFNWRSYEILWAYLTGEIRRLDAAACNDTYDFLKKRTL